MGGFEPPPPCYESDESADMEQPSSLITIGLPDGSGAPFR